MQNQNHQARQARTRMLVQGGGLLIKAGLFDAFSIQTGDDLQSPGMRAKTERLLGFLTTCLQEKKGDFNDSYLHEWQQKGQHLLRVK